jgi:hypothetical protein
MVNILFVAIEKSAATVRVVFFPRPSFPARNVIFCWLPTLAFVALIGGYRTDKSTIAYYQ